MQNGDFVHIDLRPVLPDGMYNLIPKISIWANFLRPYHRRCWYFYGHFVYFTAKWYILWPFGTFYGHLVHFMVSWYILWSFGTFYGHLVHFMVIWYILWSFGTFYGHLVHFMVIWYILWSFGIFFTVLVCCTVKNLADLTHFFAFQESSSGNAVFCSAQSFVHCLSSSVQGPIQQNFTSWQRQYLLSPNTGTNLPWSQSYNF
jgi:hypothetical protein